ncbi:putative MFS family arabinose efflux permease [Thermosporothrix hazakensis]|jgi:MFS family permease|uniref:Putative MFS family arabinose efflux permease n=1 Tax=Thermosporothrix hazakensis TaxID=644383 RepID=A0A326U8E9_THEHA|nr:MFS transporter [Thermosporothrix hazakensis]PZW31981.1 putative MFS family arabinose efflux permease [Thermosporothrix hazakensis]GCE49693.1 MFS transporter [Thermosporothrix hazakensis]
MSSSLLKTGQERSRSLWRNKDFLLLFGGQVVSTMGTTLSQFATILLMLALTNSASAAGIVETLTLLPYLLFSLPVGAFVDRWNRKLVMIVADLVRWFVLGLVPLLYVTGTLEVVHLYIVVFVAAAAGVFFSLAQISALPRLVDSAHLARAYSLSEMTENGVPLLGKNLGSLLIRLAGTPVVGAMLAFLFDSISYLLSALSLGCIKRPFHSKVEVRPLRSVWRDMLEGLRFLFTERILLALALLTMLINFLLVSSDLAVIVLSERDLHLDVLWLGLIVSANGIGVVLGGWAAPWFQRRYRTGWLLVGAIAGMACSLLLAALPVHPVILFLARMLCGAMWTLYAVPMVAYRLTVIPDGLQGRVNSAFRFLTFGIEPVGALIWGGLLLEPLGARPVLLCMGIGLFMVFLTALVGVYRLRRR